MAINPHGRVVAFEEVVINLRDTSGTCSSAGGQDGLEIGHAGLFALSGGSFSLRIQIALRRRYFADYPVDVGGGCALHIVGDVGIDVQRGRRRHMPQHGGEGLHVHTVLQGHRCEGMTEIMEPRAPKSHVTPSPKHYSFRNFATPAISIPLQNFRRLERRKTGKIAPKSYRCYEESAGRAVADRRAYTPRKAIASPCW